MIRLINLVISLGNHVPLKFCIHSRIDHVTKMLRIQVICWPRGDGELTITLCIVKSMYLFYSKYWWYLEIFVSCISWARKPLDCDGGLPTTAASCTTVFPKTSWWPTSARACDRGRMTTHRSGTSKKHQFYAPTKFNDLKTHENIRRESCKRLNSVKMSETTSPQPLQKICLAEMSLKNVSRIKYVDKCPQPL